MELLILSINWNYINIFSTCYAHIYISKSLERLFKSQNNHDKPINT